MSQAVATNRFPSPDEVAPPTGAEEWRSMYPSYLLGRDEDGEERFWFPDRVHWARPLYPFDTITVEATFLSVGVHSTHLLALPSALGIDLRIVNGYLYLSPIAVTDPDEVGRRAASFAERAGFYFGNWNELVERWRGKVEAAIAELEAIRFEPLPAGLEPTEAVLEARGRSVGFDVLRDYRRLVDLFFLVWQYHFEMVTLGYGAFGTFFQFCKETFPSISDETISRMVSGIDVLAFRPDEELKGLARKAVELGVDGAFDGDRAPAAVIADMEASEKGREWLQALEAAKHPWFNFSSNYGFYHDEVAWIQDPTFPFAGIRGYIAKLRAGQPIERDLDAVRARRDQLVEEHRAVLSESEAAQFDQLHGLAQTVFPHIEDHNFHVEHWAHTVFWAKTRELARLVTAAGYLEDPEDLYYLHRHEVELALYDLVQAWAIGVVPADRARWRATVAHRRQVHQALGQWTPAPALGTPPEVVTNPFAIMNYGITSERLREWLHGGGDQAAEDGAPALTGAPGSAGVAEGPARVILSERELHTVRPGEILVCPITAPSWTPLLGDVVGIVSDSGGMMCHAAIVCREFGVPAVVGTGFATARIRTGQRLRIDGAAGTVQVLD